MKIIFKENNLSNIIIEYQTSFLDDYENGSLEKKELSSKKRKEAAKKAAETRTIKKKER